MNGDERPTERYWVSLVITLMLAVVVGCGGRTSRSPRRELQETVLHQPYSPLRSQYSRAAVVPRAQTGSFGSLDRETVRLIMGNYTTEAALGGKPEDGFLTSEGGTMGRQNLSPLISRPQIASAVRRVARLIRNDYKDKCPLLLGVLNGSFVFMADLIRGIDIPLTVDFVRIRSYEGVASTGKITYLRMNEALLAGRHVVLVEDIVDTGYTASHLLQRLQAEGPASLKLCALLDKPSARVVPVQIDYLGLTVSEGFVVGYGLDFNQRYRYLSDIYLLKETQSGP